MARVMHERLDDRPGAAATYRDLLRAGDDEEALRFLMDDAEVAGDAEAQVDSMGRLVELVADREEKRNLLFDLAGLLQGKLDRPRDAVKALNRILSDFD